MVHLELPDEKMGFSDGKGEMFTVSSGGEILWSRQASFRIACKMNLDKLPFDTQSCGLLAGLYSQRAEQVQLRWRDPAKYEALANWEGVWLQLFASMCPHSLWSPSRSGGRLRWLAGWLLGSSHGWLGGD